MNLGKKLRHLISRSRDQRQRIVRARRKQRQSQFETLELRALCAADFRTFDGTGNNVAHPDWGSTDEKLLRTAPAQYADGIAAPAGANRVSAREISNLLADHPDDPVINNRNMSAFIYAWGQFLDHDIDLTNGASPTESFSIPVPQGDPWFDPAGTGTQTIGMSRSAYDPTTGLAVGNPRQQLNRITAFVDGSQIYGSDPARAAALRTFSGGLLKSSAGDLLPYNTMGLANDALPGMPATSMFVAGDTRANENPELLSLHTLFMREHNRVARQMASAHPDWNDEQLYQAARRVVGAELQVITYKEFLPALIGPNAIPAYMGYNANVNPGIANEFSTAAFRLGHSLLGDDIEFLDNQGHEVHDPIELRDAFFNSGVLSETGIDPILKYLASDRAEEIDTRVVDDVRNFLFGPPGAGGFDLASLNVQRGRDHGLADYNSVRRAYGLKPVADFTEITRDPATQAALRQAYGNVNNIDLWVGGLAEDHVPGASVGPLFQRILADQFRRLRDGDRYWFERDFQGPELDQMRQTTLADVIRRNSMTKNVQDNVFFFQPVIQGRVFGDGNGDQKLNPGENGLPNIVVNLRDATGALLATTRTDPNGAYKFDKLDLGSYRVQIEVPSGSQATSPVSKDILITRGGATDPILFGLKKLLAGASLSPSGSLSSSSGSASTGSATSSGSTTLGGSGSVLGTFGDAVVTAPDAPVDLLNGSRRR